jgi:hypothetical protein
MIHILVFLLGAFVAKMYYKPQIKSAQSERDAWEKKAKQATDNAYKDIMKNVSGDVDY